MTSQASSMSSAAPIALERWWRHVDRVLIPIGLFLASWFVYAWLSNGRPTNLDYFIPLADAFLHGRLGLLEGPSWLNELVPSASGLYYVVYPPMPALVLLPAVALFGPTFDQAWATVLLGAANVVLMYLVMLGMGVGRRPRVVLSLVWAFGTIVWYSAQAGSSWHIAHVVATTFMLLAILACQRDARPGLIGLLFGAAVLARLPLVLAAPFFFAYLIDRTLREANDDQTVFGALRPDRPKVLESRPDWGRVLALGEPMVLGLAVAVVGYLMYNQLRFGTPFETGYPLIPGLLQEAQYKDGFFSIVNIPRKLYALFLSGPVQIEGFPWVQPRALGGLSIILTTPLFLWSIKARRPDWFNVGAWLAVGLTLIPILLHADPGGLQFGFRYAQDFYPFLFLLTVRGLGGRLSFEAWLAIAIGALVNLWGMGATYYDWFQ
jgi:hypothetical protein